MATNSTLACDGHQQYNVYITDWPGLASLSWPPIVSGSLDRLACHVLASLLLARNITAYTGQEHYSLAWPAYPGQTQHVSDYPGQTRV